MHHNIPNYLEDIFQKDENIYNTRCYMKLQQPKFKTVTHGYHSIAYQGAKLWNVPPNNIKECKSYKGFKVLLSQWNHGVVLFVNAQIVFNVKWSIYKYSIM